MKDAELLLTGATIYAGPAESPIANGVVVIRDDKIAAVGGEDSFSAAPDGSEILDCTGLTLVAGFWNSHVHFFERKWADAVNIPGPELAAQLRAMLTRFGFTSVFDTGSLWENTRRIRDRIESGEIAGPRIRSTGEVLPQITVSIGVGQFQHGESMADLIDRCDRALYLAKKAGRNRVVSELDLQRKAG